MRTLVSLTITSLLAACGGSDSDPRQLVRLNSKDITVEADVTKAPGSIGGGASPCFDLIVGATFLANPAPIPPAMTVSQVSVLSDSQAVWSGEVIPNELFLDSEGALHAVARGCPPSDLKAGQSVVVIYKISFEGVDHFLKTAPVQVGEAF